MSRTFSLLHNPLQQNVPYPVQNQAYPGYPPAGPPPTAPPNDVTGNVNSALQE